MKDYLEGKNVDAKFPRDVIKQSFHYELIAEGEVWMDMLEKKDLIALSYNEENFKLAVTTITSSYFDVLDQLYCKLLKQL